MAFRRTTDEQEQRVSRAYAETTTSVDILARSVGVSRDTLYQILRRTRTPLRAPQRRQKRESLRHQTKMNNIRRTIALGEQEWSIEEIAVELRVQPQTVYNYRRQAKQLAEEEKEEA